MINLVSCASSAGPKLKQTTHSDRVVDSLNSCDRKAKVFLPASCEHQPVTPMDNDHQSSFNFISQSKLQFSYAQQQQVLPKETFIITPNTTNNNCSNINNKNRTKTDTFPVDHEFIYGNSSSNEKSGSFRPTGSFGWLNSDSVGFADDSDNSNISDHQSFDNVPLREKLLQNAQHQQQQSICFESMNKQTIELPESKCSNHPSQNTKMESDLLENRNIVSSLVKPTKETILFDVDRKTHRIKSNMNQMTNNDYTYNEHRILVIHKDNGSTLSSPDSLRNSFATFMPLWLTRLFSNRRRQDYSSAPTTEICDYSSSKWIDLVTDCQYGGLQSNQDRPSKLNQLSNNVDSNRTNWSKSSRCYVNHNDSPANSIDAPTPCIVVKSDQHDQHHSMLNWSTLDKDNKYSPTEIAANEMRCQPEARLSPTPSTCLFCCRLKLNQPKDYKFYLLVCLMIIGLISVIMVAIASVMIYLDNGEYCI